jgi:hypothetical protein
VILRQPLVDLGELSWGRGRRGGQLRGRGQLAKELLVIDIDAITKGLGAEQNLQRDDLDVVAIAPLLG